MSNCRSAERELPHNHFCFAATCRVTFPGDVHNCPVCNRPERKLIYRNDPLTSESEIEAKRQALPSNQNFNSPYFLMPEDTVEAQQSDGDGH